MLTALSVPSCRTCAALSLPVPQATLSAACLATMLLLLARGYALYYRCCTAAGLMRCRYKRAMPTPLSFLLPVGAQVRVWSTSHSALPMEGYHAQPSQQTLRNAALAGQLLLVAPKLHLAVSLRHSEPQPVVQKLSVKKTLGFWVTHATGSPSIPCRQSSHLAVHVAASFALDTSPASLPPRMAGPMTGAAPCWLPAPVVGCPRPCPRCAGRSGAARLRLELWHPPASSSNGAGPVHHGGGAATERRPSPPTHTWSAPPGGESPRPRETAEEGGWLEQAAARIADANGGNLYATGPPAADQQRKAPPQTTPAGVTPSGDPPENVPGRSANAVPRAEVTQRDAAAATLTGTGLQSGTVPVSEAEAAKAGGQVTDAPRVSTTTGEVQPWGRTVAQALAAGEQTRRRHDEASASSG